jgi:hypothetical protein
MSGIDFLPIPHPNLYNFIGFLKISVSVNHVLSHQKNPGHVENEKYFQNRVVMKAISHFS